MCGIAGLVDSRDPSRRDILVRMGDALAHRGPDDAGVWWSDDDRVGFAHRRLAILDLSAAGHQPMSDSTGAVWVTFNGEIYNHRELRRLLEDQGHRFRTATDTEVLLAAYIEWGEACLERMEGMWAFAVYDTRSRRLFMARDRAGERPLFYAFDGRALVFASELKALFEDRARSRAVDPGAFASYLAYGYVPFDRCMIAGIKKLPAGHALTFDLNAGSLSVSRYWRLPAVDPDAGVGGIEPLADELEALLSDAVERQLVADVPVGILLSGGLDSSLITALAARARSSTRLRTFTVRFADGGSFDEGPFARLVAEHFGADHQELVAEPATVDLLPRLARQFDEPIADSSMVPTFLVSMMVRSEAKVALGGDGGDELFGGYPHYSWLQRLDRIRPMIPPQVRGGIATMATRLPAGTRGRNHLIGIGSSAYSIAHVNLYFDRASRRQLSPLLRSIDGERSPECMRAMLCADRPTTLQQATATDFLTTMVDGYLVKVDRASMLNSLEVRAPFLDRRVVEFAMGRVPDWAKVDRGRKKIVVRHLASRLLPRTLDLDRKQGFSMPLAKWFKGEWGRYVASVLRDADPGVFDPRAIERLLHGQERGLANTERLFSLAMFELWRRQYGVTLSA